MSRGKKIGIGIGIAMGVLIAVSVGSMAYREVEQRKALQNVKISFDGVDIEDIGLTNAKLDLALRMHNPNDITATLDRADYDLWGNENYLGNGAINKRTDIPAGAARTVHTDFDLDYGGAGKLVWSFLTEGGKINWRMAGTAHYDTIFGTMDIPFDLTRNASNSPTSSSPTSSSPTSNSPSTEPADQRTSIFLNVDSSSVFEGDIVVFNVELVDGNGKGIDGARIDLKDEDAGSGDDLIETLYTGSDGRSTFIWSATRMDPFDNVVEVYAVFEGNSLHEKSRSHKINIEVN